MSRRDCAQLEQFTRNVVYHWLKHINVALDIGPMGACLSRSDLCFSRSEQLRSSELNWLRLSQCLVHREQIENAVAFTRPHVQELDMYLADGLERRNPLETDPTAVANEMRELLADAEQDVRFLRFIFGFELEYVGPPANP